MMPNNGNGNIPPPPAGYQMVPQDSSVPPPPAGYTMVSGGGGTQPSPQGTPGFLGGLVGVGKGLLQSGAQTLNYAGGLSPVMWAVQQGQNLSGVGQYMQGPAQAGIQTPQPQGAAEKIGYYGEQAGEIAGSVIGSTAAAVKAAPSAVRAGKALEALDQQIGDAPVDISKMGDVALSAQDWWSHGGQRIKQISDFLREATAPGAEPMTYSDVRQFLQNAGRRLSTTEAQNMPPVGRKYLAQFASAASEAIQSTADDAGFLPEYNAAIKEYRQGMGLNNAWEWGKSMAQGMAEQAIKSAPWIGAAYAIAKKAAP